MAFLKKYPKLFLGFFILSSFLFIDFMGAQVLRYLTHKNDEAFSQREKAYRIASPEFHHGLKPLVTIPSAEWGHLKYKMITNSLGLRDFSQREIEIKHPHRFLLLGDSFTEGIGYDYEKTYAGILTQRLKLQGYEVLNGAVSSYSPRLYLAKAKYLIERGYQFKEVILFLDISDIQDEVIYDRENTSTPYFEKDQESFLLKNSVIVPYFYELFEDKPWHPIHLTRGRWTIDSSVWKDYGEDGIRLALKHMTELHEYLKSKDIQLRLVIYPWPHQVYANDIESKQVFIWSQWSKKNEVPFLNAFPPFVSGGERQARKDYLVGDIHFNETGNLKMANEVWKIWFKNLGEKTK